jgi:hypothetical protein
MLQHNFKYLLCALHFAAFFFVIMPPFKCSSFSLSIVFIRQAGVKNFCDNFFSPQPNSRSENFPFPLVFFYIRHNSSGVEIKFKLHYASLELKAIFTEATSCFVFVVHKSFFGGGAV